MKNIAVIVLAFLLFAPFGASHLRAQGKAKVYIKKNINGTVEEETREIELNGTEDIDAILQQLGVVDDIGQLKPGQEFEIKIDKSTPNGGEENFKLFFSPDGPTPPVPPARPRGPRSMSPPMEEPQAFMGVMLMDDDMQNTGEKGVWISDVVADSPAESEGLMIGDKLIEIDGQKVNSSQDVIRLVRAKKPGQKIEVKYARAGKTKKLKVELAQKEQEPWGGDPELGAPRMYMAPYPDEIPAPEINYGDYEFFFDGDSITILCPDNPNCICPNDSMRICQPFNWLGEGMQMEERAFLGVSPNGQDQNRGVGIVVEPTTAAEKMGLLSDDVIVAIDGQSVNTFEELSEIIASKKPLQPITVDVMRNGREIKLEGKLGTKTMSRLEDFRIFHDFKGQDEEGLYNYDFEFDMDKEDLQQHMEQMLRDLEMRQSELDMERQGIMDELERLQQPEEKVSITIRIAEITADELAAVNTNASTRLKSQNDLAIEQISFYPNPNNGLLNLSFTTSAKTPVQIHLYDITGNMIYTEEINQFNGSYNNQIDISSQPVGNYFLQIVQGQQTYSKKITKGQ